MVRRGISYSAAVVVIFLLSGCIKVGPDYVRPPTAVSPNWVEADDKRVKTEPVEYRVWWEVFNDPVVNSIIDRAYHDNLSLKIAGVRVLQARAQLGIAVGNIYPQTQQANGELTFNRISERSFLGSASQSASQQGVRSDGNKRPAGVKFSYWEDQIYLNAAWEIDFWGKFRRAIESADASLRMSVADYDNALVTLTADAANDYIQIRTLQKRLSIARQNVESQEESVGRMCGVPNCRRLPSANGSEEISPTCLQDRRHRVPWTGKTKNTETMSLVCMMRNFARTDVLSCHSLFLYVISQLIS